MGTRCEARQSISNGSSDQFRSIQTIFIDLRNDTGQYASDLVNAFLQNTNSAGNEKEEKA